MPFWKQYRDFVERFCDENRNENETVIGKIFDLVDDIGQRMAVALANLARIVFLYQEITKPIKFSNDYSLYCGIQDLSWRLVTGNQSYLLQLPESIMKQYLCNAESI